MNSDVDKCPLSEGYLENLIVVQKEIQKLTLEKAGTKVGPDQLGSPVRVGSTRINSDRLGS